MTRDFLLLAVLAVLIAAAVATWRYAADAANAKHCNEMLEGLAVYEGQSGRVVCIRRDSVLRIYR